LAVDEGTLKLLLSLASAAAAAVNDVVAVAVVVDVTAVYVRRAARGDDGGCCCGRRTTETTLCACSQMRRKRRMLPGKKNCEKLMSLQKGIFLCDIISMFDMLETSLKGQKSLVLLIVYSVQCSVSQPGGVPETLGFPGHPPRVLQTGSFNFISKIYYFCLNRTFFSFVKKIS
jgi:hypothetical protein